jgi:hypothetical protein
MFFSNSKSINKQLADIIKVLQEKICELDKKIEYLETRCTRLEDEQFKLREEFANKNIQIAKEIIREGKKNRN